jgi:hypothetical protein
LSDGGERITLARPGTPGAGSPPAVPYVAVDRITYQDTIPWPTTPDGTGPSLARVSSPAYGNDSANWRAEPAFSPGRLNFDTAAPVADVLDVLPDPRTTGADTITIRFDEPVRGLDLADLSLTRNNGANLLTGAQTLSSADGATWTLSNLAGLTNPAGSYVLTLRGSNSGIADYGNHALTAGASDAFVVNPNAFATVAGRWVFYNHSAFDGNDAAAGAADDGAIAATKSALLPGQSRAFANYTSFFHGINGIMLDVAGLHGLPTAADFIFKAGTDSNPAGWAAAPPPLSITRRAGAGAGGSDRVTIVWADDVIRNKWLQVTVKPNAATTGLAANDVFYFGNLAGETGDNPAAALVNALDLAAVKRALGTAAPVGSTLDINRDGRVSALDLAAVKQNLGRGLPLLTAPAALAPAGVFSEAAAAAVRRVWDEAAPDVLA